MFFVWKTSSLLGHRMENIFAISKIWEVIQKSKQQITPSSKKKDKKATYHVQELS
jgi:hypothetical protein